jgi:hypothetical protein
MTTMLDCDALDEVRRMCCASGRVILRALK